MEKFKKYSVGVRRILKEIFTFKMISRIKKFFSKPKDVVEQKDQDVVEQKDKEIKDYFLINVGEESVTIYSCDVLPWMDISEFFEQYIGDFTTKKSTCTENKIMSINEDKRSSESFEKSFNLSIPELEKFCKERDLFYYQNKWELIKYEIGDHFSRHKDKSLKSEHKYTVLLYPFISVYEGGDLILYKDNIQFFIETSKFNCYTLVIFDISLYHEVTELLSGIKYVFKSQLYENQNMLED